MIEFVVHFKRKKHQLRHVFDVTWNVLIRAAFARSWIDHVNRTTLPRCLRPEQTGPFLENTGFEGAPSSDLYAESFQDDDHSGVEQHGDEAA